MNSEITKSPGIEAGALLAVTAKSPATESAYRGVVARWVRWAGNRPLSARLFDSWIKAEKKAGASASKLRQEIFGGKSAIMQAAEKAGLSAGEYGALKAALDSIKAPEPAPPEIRVVDGHERHEILKEMAPRLALVMRTLYATGARVSEILGVRKTDVKVEGERVSIRIMGKGSKERKVRIPAALLGDINDEYNTPGRVYLFESSPGKPYSRQWINHEIGRAARVAIGRRVTAHDMRHSRATDLFRTSKNLKGVSTMLGHSSIEVTARFYVKSELSDEELTEGEAL